MGDPSIESLGKCVCCGENLKPLCKHIFVLEEFSEKYCEDCMVMVYESSETAELVELGLIDGEGKWIG